MRVRVDHELAVRACDLELDDVGAEVVLVPVLAHLRGEAHGEVVDLLAATRRGTDAQRVDVVDDVGVVSVAAEVADREVHLLALVGGGAHALVHTPEWTAATAATAK